MQAPEWATHIVSGNIRGTEEYVAAWVADGKFQYFAGWDQGDLNHSWKIEDWERGIKLAGWLDAKIEEISICLENK